MATKFTTPAQVRYALHEGRISKREATQRLDSIPATHDRRASSFDLPYACDGCGKLYWMDTLIQVSPWRLVCSDCYQ